MGSRVTDGPHDRGELSPQLRGAVRAGHDHPLSAGSHAPDAQVESVGIPSGIHMSESIHLASLPL